MVVLQSRGQDPKKMENYGTNLSTLLTRIRTLSPWLENNNTLKCWSGIFPKTLIYVVMFENCRNIIGNLWVSSNPEEKIQILAEARISECNVCFCVQRHTGTHFHSLICIPSIFHNFMLGNFPLDFPEMFARLDSLSYTTSAKKW